ncbi:MAG: hypothetical protein QOG34_470 [Frankiaceae bacterium]|nr:hypothetical protein [Frankiaceae bacterium]
MKRLLTVVVCVVVGGSLVLLAAGQRWGSATINGAARQHVSVTGGRVSAGLPALALALLALAVAALAARGLLRRAVGAVGFAVAVTEISVAVQAHSDVGDALRARAFGVAARSVPIHANAWWLFAVAGGVLAAVAFGAVFIAGGRWPGMGARYDAPRATARPADPAAAAWEALDRGDDPTSDPA